MGERQEQASMDPALKSQLRKIPQHLRDGASRGWRECGEQKAEARILKAPEGV